MMVGWKDLEYNVDLIAQVIHDAEPKALLWDEEPPARQARFREYARNAIQLLDDDIGVLILALEQAKAEQREQGPGSSA